MYARTFNTGFIDQAAIELADELHEQTRYHRTGLARRRRSIARYLTDKATIEKATKLYPVTINDLEISLPAPETCRKSLRGALSGRRSTPRPGLAGTISLQSLSTVLDLAVRSNGSQTSAHAPGSKYELRPYPSAGALYPCELYLISSHVGSLDPRPYRYDARHHSLIDYGAGPCNFHEFEASSELAPPPCAMIITAVLSRTTGKYGARGYRFAALEAGHLSQNLVLAAEALNIKSLVYGTFYDAEVERALGIDGIDEVVMTTVLLGGADGISRSAKSEC